MAIALRDVGGALGYDRIAAASTRAPRVALVYPPWGPLAPPLGLALLSAGVKALGFECRTFNWNVAFVSSYPAARARRRIAMHRAVSYLFPLNEWVFLKEVFPESDDQDPRIAARMAGVEAAYGAVRSRKHSYQVESGLAQDPVSPSAWLPRMRPIAARSVAQMADKLADFDIIGISSTFSQNMAALALAKKIKARWPGKTVVFGGANCDDVMGETLLGQFPFIDYVFAGEVDFSFPEFVRRVATREPTQDVPGIIYRDAEGRVTRGPVAEPLEDLNRLPMPDYDDYVRERAASDVHILPLTLALESSRGCWWGAKQHCVFCGLNANGMAFRSKVPGRFQAELEHVATRYRPKHLSMTDNIISTSYYGEFVEWAHRRRLDLDFFYEIKANLNRQQVRRLSDAGITSLQPGIESFSSAVLALMRKGIHGIQNVAFLKYASDYGVMVYYNILGGFQGEDPEDYYRMARNLPALVHLQPPAYGVGAAQYQRFSPMFREAGDSLLPLPGYFELYPFSEDVLMKMAYHFEAREAQPHPYFEPVSDAVLRWRESWSVRGCTLTWTPAADGILIRDRRPGFARRNYRLTDYAVTVFHELDRPRKLAAIGRELPMQPPGEATGPRKDAASGVEGGAADGVIDGADSGYLPRLRALTHAIADRFCDEVRVSFTREDFRRDPDGSVARLVQEGIIYVEDGSCLMLPVAERRRSPRADWVNFRIPAVSDGFRRVAAAARAQLIDWRELAAARRRVS